ncbi:3-hydroxyisobutyrate dehydrogenase [Alcaligenes aquatilis]|uniref:3-hydroxyisobutyrate dehydrogenase n=1 Tax=Alcaligenes aquatilis TaxID=323284 RepID=UPI003D25B367
MTNQNQRSTTIAFIGLGNMGGPMAANLHKAGYVVAAFDLSAAACERIASQGIMIAGSAAAACEGADIVISMLPAGRHVEALYLGDASQAGLLEQLKPDTLVIDSSTISTTSALRVAHAAQAAGIAMIDAPVSGGTGGAIAGTLTFMVGGSDDSVERARPVLEVMGKNIFYAGVAGAGQAAKICNNMLLGILMVGTSEALALGKVNGLDPAVLSEIMRLSSGGNWALEKYNPVPGIMENAPASKAYEGGFGTDLMLKDLGLAMESAHATGAITPLGTLARQVYALHSKAGNGDLDFSSVIRQLQ